MAKHIWQPRPKFLTTSLTEVMWWPLGVGVSFVRPSASLGNFRSRQPLHFRLRVCFGALCGPAVSGFVEAGIEEGNVKEVASQTMTPIPQAIRYAQSVSQLDSYVDGFKGVHPSLKR